MGLKVVNVADLRADSDRLRGERRAKRPAFEAKRNVRPEGQPGTLPRYRIQSEDEIASRPLMAWRVRGVLPVEGVAGIYGPPGSGKSFLAADLVDAVSEGRDWFGHRVSACPVVYVALEGEAGLAQRVRALQIRRGRASDSLRFVAGEPFHLLEADDVRALADSIVAAGGRDGIVVIDTLAQATPGMDENAGADMTRAVASAQDLRAMVGGLVLLVHHSGKDATRGMRGHSSLHAAMDAVIEVERNEDLRTWRKAKTKDGADGEAFPFRLEVVEVGADEFGESVTSCVVGTGTVEAFAERRLVPAGGNQRLAYDRMSKLLKDAGDGRPDGAPEALPHGRPAVTLDAAVGAVADCLPVEPKRRRERAQQAITGLISRRLLCHEAGFVWWA